jgi:hypothetical protein
MQESQVEHEQGVEGTLKRRLIFESAGQLGDKRLFGSLAHRNRESPKALGPFRIKCSFYKDLVSLRLCCLSHVIIHRPTPRRRFGVRGT